MKFCGRQALLTCSLSGWLVSQYSEHVRSYVIPVISGKPHKLYENYEPAIEDVTPSCVVSKCQQHRSRHRGRRRMIRYGRNPNLYIYTPRYRHCIQIQLGAAGCPRRVRSPPTATASQSLEERSRTHCTRALRLYLTFSDASTTGWIYPIQVYAHVHAHVAVGCVVDLVTFHGGGLRTAWPIGLKKRKCDPGQFI